jgi:sugar/nucleoside kinase (ribokinase family)
VADEVGADAIRVHDDVQPRAAILQGWLRTTAGDGEVIQLPLASLDQRRRDALATLDIVIASREDLAAEANSPSDQLAALRTALGGRPVLVVTDAINGLWLDVPRSPDGGGRQEQLSVPWRVDEVATVGAGDMLAAFLTMHAKDPPQGWRQHAAAAMQVVAEELEARAGR